MTKILEQKEISISINVCQNDFFYKNPIYVLYTISTIEKKNIEVKPPPSSFKYIFK